MTETSPVYPRAASGKEREAPASARFPEIEERILKYWDEDGTFKASVEQRQGEEFVFYDGPPFANGLPHYGHLLTGYAKDLVPRYRTMRGQRVERRFGWDTHGLPAELSAMKELGMRDKAEIEAMGIDTFNDACRSNVLQYTKEWRATSPAKPAGSISRTTTRPSTSTSWSRSSGRSSSSTTRA